MLAISDLYEHPLYIRLGALARKMGGHGGMDFIMRYRMVECLCEGFPLDQNLYEGCFGAQWVHSVKRQLKKKRCRRNSRTLQEVPGRRPNPLKLWLDL